MDGVIDDASHNTDSDGNPNVFKLERNDDGLWLNDNWAEPDDEWDPGSKFVLRLRNCFLSAALHVAVFLFRIVQILLPTTEHLADFPELQSDVLALLVGNEFSFPRDRDKKLQSIQHQNAVGNLFRFPLFFGKIGDICQFQKIKQFIFNSQTDSISSPFCNMRRNIHPKQISLFDSAQDGGVIERERESKSASSYL